LVFRQEELDGRGMWHLCGRAELYTGFWWGKVRERRTKCRWEDIINRLTPNDPYMGRTAPLTSKRCILYIYSKNIGTEYFKHALYSPFLLFKMHFVS